MDKKEKLQSTENSTTAHSSTNPVEEKLTTCVNCQKQEKESVEEKEPAEEKLVTCVKCQKQEKESAVVKTKKGVLCQKCHAKLLKRKKITRVLGGFAIVACLVGIGIYFATGDKCSNVKGFSGNTTIKDSMTIMADSVKQNFSLSNTTAVSANAEVSEVATNIEAFKSSFSNSVKKAEKNEASQIGIPSIGLLFHLNSSELNESDKNLLKAFVAAYKKTNQKTHISISGYTCNLGTNEVNNAISQNRALAVKQSLMSEGISEDNLSVKWYGKTKNSTFNYPTQADYRRVIVEIK